MSSIRSRAPSASSERVAKVMRAVPARDTKPEVALRSALHRMGCRFRKDTAARDLRKTQDLIDDDWLVLRFWEHDIARSLDSCVQRVLQELESSGIA